VRRSTADAFPRGLRAIVLTGSLARGEGTWVHDNRGCSLAGDAEFLVLFSDGVRLPSAQLIEGLRRSIELRLHAESVDAHIGLSPVYPTYLRRLRPHIFAYELVQHGKVVWGERHILDLAPRFSPAEIPVEDGFRLLMNRIIELIDVLCTGPHSTAPQDSYCGAVHYRVMKLWLDMATSFLLFQGRYESTYRSRAESFAQMASRSGSNGDGLVVAPIPLERFAERVSFATNYKLGTGRAAASISERDLCDLIDDVHALWRWELERLVAQSVRLDDARLLSRWLRSEELTARTRSWAAITKRFGLERSARMLPRWVGLSFKGSPRRLVYAAASRLLFALPRILQLLPGEGDSRKEVRTLPVLNARNQLGWREAGDSLPGTTINFWRQLVPERQKPGWLA